MQPGTIKVAVKVMGTPEEESLEATLENRHKGCGRDTLGQTVPRMRVMKCVKSKLGSDDSWKLFAVCVIGTTASIHCQYDK